MPHFTRPDPLTKRATHLLVVLGVHAVVFWLLLKPVMHVLVPVDDSPALVMVDIPATPPPVPEAPPEPEGASAPEAPKAEAKPVAAPKPDIILPEITLPPVPAAAADGPDLSAGDAEHDAGGTSAGGEGIGPGKGGAGTGTGDGGLSQRARRIAGNITRRDFPAVRGEARTPSSVTVRLHIAPDGRVQQCDIVRSSGNPDRDAITCRLAQERFRYEPARDAHGNPAADIAGWRQDWFDRK